MTRKEFLHCQTCANCYSHRCQDMTNISVSLCKVHHWPTYKPDCKDFVLSDDEAHAWARGELKLINEGKL